MWKYAEIFHILMHCSMHLIMNGLVYNQNYFHLPVPEPLLFQSFRPLINSSTGAIQLAGIILLRYLPLLAGKLTSHPQAFDSTYYWMIENKAYRYDNGNFVETHLCIQDASPSDTSSLLYLTENEDNKKALCISTRNAPWMLIQTLPDPKTCLAITNLKKLLFLIF